MIIWHVNSYNLRPDCFTSQVIIWIIENKQALIRSAIYQFYECHASISTTKAVDGASLLTCSFQKTITCIIPWMKRSCCQALLARKKILHHRFTSIKDASGACHAAKPVRLTCHMKPHTMQRDPRNWSRCTLLSMPTLSTKWNLHIHYPSSTRTHMHGEDYDGCTYHLQHPHACFATLLLVEHKNCSCCWWI
jgi:hypothetical protein